MKRFIIISTLIIITGLGILFLTFNTSKSLHKSTNTSFNHFCGTNAFTTEKSSEGKSLFNANCASCHKLDHKMTGPALRGIAQKYDSINLSNYIQGKNHTIEDKGYGLDCTNFPQLTKEDIANILAYTN